MILACIRVLQFKPLHHKAEHMIPAVKAYIPGQGTDIIKKGLSCGEFCANHLIALIHHLKDGMKQKGQDVEGEQEG